jgi:hypothetical protein
LINFSSSISPAKDQSNEYGAAKIQELKVNYKDEVETAVRKGLPTVDRSALDPNYIYDMHGHIEDVI